MYVKQKDRGLNSSTDPEAWIWGFPYKTISQNEILGISSIAIKPHRKKGPAYEGKEGIFFYINGFLHRDNDLPAATYNKRKDWFQYGIRHREKNLPAIEYENGDCEYWENGEKIVFEDELEVETTEDFTKYYLNGLLHRSIKPAVEYKNGDKEWWYKGLLDRTKITINSKYFQSLPAIHRADGSAEWLNNGIYINSDWNSIDAKGRKYKYSGTYKNRKLISSNFPIEKITYYKLLWRS